MENTINYSFDDEVVSAFFYDTDNKVIKVYFTGYFDNLEKEYYDRPCILTIQNWKKAKSKLSSNIKYEDLDDNMGIFSMILFMEMKSKELELVVNTLDDRHIDLLFIEPEIGFE